MRFVWGRGGVLRGFMGGEGREGIGGRGGDGMTYEHHMIL